MGTAVTIEKHACRGLKSIGAGEEQEIVRPIPRPSWTWAYRREAEYFIANLRNDEPFRSSAEDTRTDVRLFE